MVSRGKKFIVGLKVAWDGLLLFTFMTEGLEGMDFERIASTWTRSCATACTNCLPSLFNAFVILQCASCQHDLLDQACTSVALALGAYPLLRRSIGMDCSRKITSQTLCASELPPGRGYVSRYPQNLGHTLSPEKQVRIGLAAVRESPKTQDKAERLMVSFVVALLHEPGDGAA